MKNVIADAQSLLGTEDENIWLLPLFDELAEKLATACYAHEWYSKVCVGKARSILLILLLALIMCLYSCALVVDSIAPLRLTWHADGTAS